MGKVRLHARVIATQVAEDASAGETAEPAPAEETATPDDTDAANRWGRSMEALRRAAPSSQVICDLCDFRWHPHRSRFPRPSSVVSAISSTKKHVVADTEKRFSAITLRMLLFVEEVE